ncbi:uncharacterized protein TNCT_301951 [Trichonephila clavata]|uniref:Uncharacterized protein n=1 Tax=Trichonephila clavata TaxID=2740835 RepID=A0A8X6J0L5_TRICU|nr:uncharacterized protein TNCT_301951 [Trichonephila clavata]
MEESMLSSKKDINQQLHDTIYKKVTKKTHNHESPKKNGDGTIKKCIELFKKEADPNVLSNLKKLLSEKIELEKSPEKKEEYQKHYKYYIEYFLPALKTGVMELEVKLPVFNNKIEQSQRSPTRRGKILEIISGIIKRSSNKDHFSSTIQNQNDRENSQISSIEGSNDNETDSGINSPGLASSSRRSSVSSILSSAGENNNLQKENENQMQPEQAVEEEPQVSSQCVTLGSREKESMDPNSQTTQMTGSQAKDPMQPEEKEERAVSSKQEASKDILSKKQSNNRNLHVALVAGCALSTIGCIIAGAMTSGLVGAGLLAMAAVFAIAAVAELHSNFLSSKLTSINVSPLVDDKELTAL